MADEPIKVSSTSWTGLTVEEDQPPPQKAGKRPLWAQTLGLCALGMAISLYGAYGALASGETSARWDKHITQNEDPIAFGIGVAALVLFGLFCFVGLVTTLMEAWRGLRTPKSVTDCDVI